MIRSQVHACKRSLGLRSGGALPNHCIIGAHGGSHWCSGPSPEKDFARPSESTGFVSSFLVDKLMTTKYPLGVILVELCHQLARRRAALRAQWVPRLENEEADALTNSDFPHFLPERRIEVDLETLPFGFFPRLLECGEGFVAELEAINLAKVSDTTARPRGAASRAKLCETDSHGCELVGELPVWLSVQDSHLWRQARLV